MVSIPRQFAPETESKLIVPNILSKLSACAMLPPAEIRSASGRGSKSGQLLAAGLISLYGGTDGADRIINDYLMYEQTRDDLVAIRYKIIPASKKALQIEAIKKKQDTLATTAGRFNTILNEVIDYANAFDTKYMSNGPSNDRPDRDALNDLYDRTDELNHPILGALRPAHSAESDSIRATVIGADRIIRHALDQIFPTHVSI